MAPRGRLRPPITATPISRSTCVVRSPARWLSTDLLARPVIGIADTYSGYNNCHRHFPELIDAVKRGVLADGWPAADLSDDLIGEVFLNPTSLMFRNLMAIDTEEMIRAQPMDAVVLMAAARRRRRPS